MEGPQTAPDRRQDFKRNAPNSASIDLFVCLPQPANLRIPHTSTTNHIPTLRADSFQSGNCDSGLDCFEVTEGKTAFSPTPGVIRHFDLRLRSKSPTGRICRPTQSKFSSAH